MLKQVRRYKAEQGLSVGAELGELRISTSPEQRALFEATQVDLKSATRAKAITFCDDATKNDELLVIR